MIKNAGEKVTLPIDSWGRSSAGRALDSHFRGQGFDPPRLHHRKHNGSDDFVGTVFLPNTQTNTQIEKIEAS